MSKFSNYYKVVEKKPLSAQMADSQDLTNTGVFSNYSWYSRLISGSASRLSRYREYDLMDNDVDIARALDVVAEEMTGNNLKTDDPLDLDFEEGKVEKLTPAMVETVKAALAYWSRIHDWENRLFNVARQTVKYGDTFFLKKSYTTKWEFIHAKNVIAAVVDADDVTKVQGWQVKKDTNKFSGTNSMSNFVTGTGQQADQTELLLADQMVRFTLNSDMSESAPFGESILKSVYRSYKQKELLEDALIIYRIQRAPERRVFYIDVGKMQPHKIKTYLEGIKNEIRQKRVPSFSGGQDEIDSVYNPHCIALDTEIPLLDGRTLTLSEMIEEYEAGKQNWVYSVNPDSGEIVPGPVSWAGVTRKNAEAVRLTLDNGETIVCTPDHKFPTQNRGRVEAKDLTPEDSLFPFLTRTRAITGETSERGYEQIYQPESGEWEFTHRIVAKFMEGVDPLKDQTFDDRFSSDKKGTIHHADFDKRNNSPSNLVRMSNRDHIKLHSVHAKEFAPPFNTQKLVFSDEMIRLALDILYDNPRVGHREYLDKLNSSDQFMAAYEKANRLNLGVYKPISKINLRQFSETAMQDMFLRNKLGCFRQARDEATKTKLTKISSERLQYIFPDRDIRFLKKLVELWSEVSTITSRLTEYLKDNPTKKADFLKEYYSIFPLRGKRNDDHGFSHREISQIAGHYGCKDVNSMMDRIVLSNHRIAKVEVVETRDVGCITVDIDHRYHNFHTFATASGVFTFNSMTEDFFLAVRNDQRGTKIDTLAGGSQSLGNLEDLDYFMKKVFRGLRIPESYMQQGGDSGPGASWNDGQVGVAYIQELRFATYVKRLQGFIEGVLDVEFKDFLRKAQIFVDESLFKVRLPEPSNFGTYRQQALDTALLGTYGSADGIQYLSKRFIMKRYLKLDDSEMVENEKMLREEKGLAANGGAADFPMIYGGMMPEDGGMGGGFGGGLGGMPGGTGGLGGEMPMGGEMGGEMPAEGGMEGEAPGGEAGAAPEAGAPAGAETAPPPAA